MTAAPASKDVKKEAAPAEEAPKTKPKYMGYVMYVVIGATAFLTGFMITYFALSKGWIS